jgi:hypothetical protein
MSKTGTKCDEPMLEYQAVCPGYAGRSIRQNPKIDDPRQRRASTTDVHF